MALKSIIQLKWLNEMAAAAKSAPPGALVEVGVYQGGSAEILYGVAREQGRELHLFDTFCGIPHKTDIDRHVPGDFSDVDLPALRRAMPHAYFHVGIFPDTLLAEPRDIAFIHADVDQYESQKAVNRHLWPRTVPGGIMLLDDYFLLAGIAKAIDEDFPGKLQHPGEGTRPFLVKE